MKNDKKKFFKNYERKQFSHYKLEKLIDNGGFGGVFESINLENKKNYAIKMILKNDIEDKRSLITPLQFSFIKKYLII